MVFVSHDRYFIDNLATRVFEVADGAVQVFPGNYEDYLWRKQQQTNAVAVNDGLAKSAAAETNGETNQDGADSKPEPKKRVNPIKLRQMAERCEELEEAIARVEGEIADAEQALTVFVSAEETQRTVELLAGKRSELEALVAEWSEVSHLIEDNG